MWKATFRGIAARKVRLALSAVAVLLGVTFVSGTYVLTDTLHQSFQGVFRQTLAGVDLVVRRAAPFGGGGNEAQNRFPDQVLAQARGVPGVAAATGFVQGYAQFVDHAGHAIQNAGAPTIGLAWAQPGSHGPLRLIRDGSRPSRAPSRAGEVAMDAGTARRYGFRVGGPVAVLLQGPKQRFRIVGLFGVGTRADLGALTFAAFDVRTAQAVFGAPGQLDAINVTAAPFTDLRALRASLQATLGPEYEVVTPAQVADDRGAVVLNYVNLLTQLLLGFAVIGMVVAAFIIFNTFMILVAQRTHELGLLRVLGASGGQVIGAVVAEAAVIGALAAGAGLGAGYGLARFLLSIAGQLGFDVPSEPPVLEVRTVVAALGVGVVVTVASSAGPAIRAARVPPIAATTDQSARPPRPVRWRAGAGVALLTAGAVLVVIGLDRTRDASDTFRDLWWVALGAVLILVGVLVLLAAVAGPLAALLGAPLRRAGVAGTLARENATRNPRRTAATASALVIGLALVGLVAIFADSAKASVRHAVDRGIRADVIVKAQQFATFSPQVAQQIARLPHVAAVTAFRFGNVRVPVGGNQETVAGASPIQLAQTVDLQVRRGSIAAMGTDGVLVASDAARQYHLGVGDPVAMQFPQGILAMRVAGIYGQRDFTGGLPVGFVIAAPTYEQGFGTGSQDTLVYVRAAPGQAATVTREIRSALHDQFPNVHIFTRGQYRSDQERAIDRFLAVAIALLMLSEIIAVLGIVNTLALSVVERTHELGLLRVVGMSRRQLRRMIRAESVLVALLGGLVGAGVGVFWGWVFTRALRAQGVSTLSVPTAQLVGFLVLAMLAGVVAAIGPAWRAARVDVLAAIAAD